MNSGQKTGSGTPDLWFIASVAGRSAAIFAGGMLALAVLTGQLHRWFGFGRRIDWQFVSGDILFSLFSGVIWFCVQFSMIYFARRENSRVEVVLEEASRNPQFLSAPCFGFVAMEGTLFTWHRTFIIFVAREALYAWRVQGWFGSPAPSVFASYAEWLKDEALTRDLAKIKGLATLPGGFVLSRSRLKSVEFTPKRKWGMGFVRHSGRIFITSESGHRREFILLGEVDGPAIQQNILAVG